MKSQSVMKLMANDSTVRGWYGDFPQDNTGIAPPRIGCLNWHENNLPYYQRYGPPTGWPMLAIDDKTNKAFAIAKKLVASEWMHAKKIEDFIALVELIEGEL